MDVPQIINIKSALPSKGSLRQLFLMIVAVVLVMFVYHKFFAKTDKPNEDLLKMSTEKIQQENKDLKDEIENHQKIYKLRSDTIQLLNKKLKSSEKIQKNLKSKLYEARKELQLATDADNIDFFLKYIESYKPSK